MRKIVFLLLISALSIFILAGCELKGSLSNYALQEQSSVIVNKHFQIEDTKALVIPSNEINNQQTDPNYQEPGLYDHENNLLASWHTLENTYGFNVEKEVPSRGWSDASTYLRNIIRKNDCFKNATKLVIPSGVKVIGDFAFYQCGTLTDIIIPDSVTNTAHLKDAHRL